MTRVADNREMEEVLKARFKIKNPERVKVQIWGHIVVIIFSLVMAICFNAFLSMFGATHEADGGVKERGLMLEWIYICIMAPLFEELIFRYFLYHRMKLLFHVKGRNLVLATISSFAFGIYHNIPFLMFGTGPDYSPQVVYAFVMGQIFCLIYDWSKDIGSTFIIHILINTMATTLNGTKGFMFLLDDPIGRMISFGVGIPVMLMCYLAFRKAQKRTAELDQKDEESRRTAEWSVLEFERCDVYPGRNVVSFYKIKVDCFDVCAQIFGVFDNQIEAIVQILIPEGDGEEFRQARVPALSIQDLRMHEEEQIDECFFRFRFGTELVMLDVMFETEVLVVTMESGEIVDEVLEFLGFGGVGA